MESNFTSPVHWENEGVEPSTTLKKTGFQGGYKPPASVFNYFSIIMKNVLKNCRQLQII